MLYEELVQDPEKGPMNYILMFTCLLMHTTLKVKFVCG